MSRFWSKASDSEEEEEDIYSSGYSDADDDDNDDDGQQKGRGASYFMKGYASSDSEEEKRTVRSAKEKSFGQLEDTVNTLTDALDAKNWGEVATAFAKLQDQAKKAKKVFKKEGIPTFYVAALVRLENEHGAVSKADKKKMNKKNAKSFNSMTQKIVKHNKDYTKEITQYKEKQSAADGDDDMDADVDDVIVVRAPTAPILEAPSSFYSGGTGKAGKSKKRDLKKSAEAVQEQSELQKILARRGKRGLDKQEQVRDLAKLLSQRDTVSKELVLWFHTMAAIFDTCSISGQMSAHYWRQAWKGLTSIVNLLAENPNLKLKEKSQIDDITEEEEESDEVYVVGNLLVFIERLDEELTKILQLIDSHTEKYVQRLRDLRLVERLATNAHDYYERVGDMDSCARIALLRMNHLYIKQEWIRELQYKAYQKEFEEETQRLKEALEKGVEVEPDKDDIAAAEDEDEDEEDEESDEDADEDGDEDDEDKELKRIEKRIQRQSERLKPKDKPVVPLRHREKREVAQFENGNELLRKLSMIIYQNGDERQKTRALLFLVYNHALNNRFHEARDLLLMSHLQDTVHHMDVPTQIMFNRATVQLGLSAFRNGMITDAHSCLSDICSIGKIKELLAQGGTRQYQDKTPEEERQEKIRQIPFHMHINLDQVECAHLLSAMLLEVPNMAAHAFDHKRKVISRPFRKLLDYFDRQHLTGPPENTRETIVAAARALQKGNWRQSYEHVLSLRMWKLLPEPEKVQEMLKQKLKEEALHTYLLSYSGFYSTLKLSDLVATYELPSNVIHGLVSKMIINDELHAAWDQPTDTIIMHNVELSRIQALSLQYAEKVNIFVEANERALDSRTGSNTFSKSHDKQKWQNDRGNNNKRPYKNKRN